MEHNTRSWREAYKQAYREDRKLKYPICARDFPYQDPVIPSERKANGLTTLIIRWLSFHGHYANRISTQGQARVTRGTVKWTKGHTKKGTPDISAIVYGRAVWIEVKVGADRMSEAQDKQQADIVTAGGIHFIARDMQTFVDFYYKLIEKT